MTCRSCTEARAAAKASARAFVRGDIREGATRAKEAAGHVADKARAESERVRKLLGKATRLDGVALIEEAYATAELGSAVRATRWMTWLTE